MGNNVGLECEIISGTAKNSLKSIGRKSGRRDHMWNAVKINDKWQLVDNCVTKKKCVDVNYVTYNTHTHTHTLLLVASRLDP